MEIRALTQRRQSWRHGTANMDPLPNVVLMKHVLDLSLDAHPSCAAPSATSPFFLFVGDGRGNILQGCPQDIPNAKTKTRTFP